MVKDETNTCPLCGKIYGFINFPFKDREGKWMCAEDGIKKWY